MADLACAYGKKHSLDYKELLRNLGMNVDQQNRPGPESVAQVMAESSDPVIGYENGPVTIPCSYAIQSAGYSMCWGRGACPYSKCSDEIIRTDGEKVTWRKSDRYQLLGDIGQGDVSMTITGATKEDEGTYCCRVEFPGWFNDLKKNLEVKIEKGNPKTTDHPATSTEHDMFTELEQCPED
ncbi:T-cell immunoglobulin and mucin domain-containing protein 4-like [Leptodactylus fuscus]